MYKWRWYEYDVWGNKKDGYDVNQVFRTSEIFEFTDNIDDAKSLLRYLRKVGWLKKGVRSKLLDIDWHEHEFYIMYKGKPVGEFRRE